MAKPADERLGRRLAAGEAAAFAELYDRLGARLYGAALILLREPAEAEDAVQDVFVGLARAHADLAGVESLEAYLFASLRRAAGRRLARRQSEGRMLREVAARADPPREAPPMPEPADGLEQALAGLPPEQREVVAMKISGELTFSQIGRTLGISPHTAASRYRYALVRLREALGGSSP